MFATNHSLDFTSLFNLGTKSFNIVKSSKILGLMINDQLKWDTHIEYVYNKVRQGTWTLRRLLEITLDHEVIIDFYQK